MTVDRASIQDELRAAGLNGESPESHRIRLLSAAERITAADVATIDDLMRAGSEVRWLWPGWIPLGVLTALAAKGGTGKTRFVADLVRRMHHKLTWPDGETMCLPEHDALALWVVADNHHDEMVTLTRDFGITDAVRINAPRSDPYAGVSLETDEDLIFLEARIKAVRPAFVVVDTVGNSTDKNMSRQEDAKAYYQPLQIIARKYRCAILCLTHLNAGGQFLGRRVLEKVRVAIRIDHFEEIGLKRRLEVRKSNSMMPPALGLVMGSAGNEYDHEPPEPPSEDLGGQLGGQLNKAVEWLRAQFAGASAIRVGITIESAKTRSISRGSLYRARDILKLEEFKQDGHTWWALVSNDSATGI